MKRVVFIVLGILLLFGCTNQNIKPSALNPQSSIRSPAPEPATSSFIPPTREFAIPQDALKITPEIDLNPPRSKTSEYSSPVPLPLPINTAGAEDSPFITPNGNTLYFFFTPDVRVPANRQLFDNVTGIYVSRKTSDGGWANPERVFLTESGKLALDGCEFVQGNEMLFCSAREGYSGINWFSAEFANGKWQNWQNAAFDSNYKVGELHISSDGNELYFHSDRAGGKGELDLWVSKKVNGVWQEPQNLDELSAKPKTLNTERSEGWPFISQDGSELWFYRDYGLWRSKRADGTTLANGSGTSWSWSEPELMFSPLAGEASLDREGNVYFTHHFFRNNTMIEADIYVAKKRQNT